MASSESKEKNVTGRLSRRKFLGLSSAAAAGAIAGVGVVAGVGGYFAGQTGPRGLPQTVTVTQTGGVSTITQTATQTSTVTQTVTQGPAQRTIKLAYLDAGGSANVWAQATIQGIAAAAQRLEPLGVKIEVTQNLQVLHVEGARVMRQFAEAGFDLILADTVGYEEGMRQVAAEFPNQKFMSVAFLPNSPQMSCYSWDVWLGYYPAGVLAGLMTKTNVIGFVTAFEFDQANQGINAFREGALSVNPNVEALWAFTGDWHDPIKGGSAADAMVAQGADLLTGMGNGMTDGVLKAAERQGKYAIGYIFDQAGVAPDAVLTSVIWNKELYFLRAFESLLDGTYGNQFWAFGASDRIVSLAPYGAKDAAIPAEVKQKVNEVIQKLYSGELQVPVIKTLPSQ